MEIDDCPKVYFTNSNPNMRIKNAGSVISIKLPSLFQFLSGTKYEVISFFDQKANAQIKTMLPVDVSLKTDLTIYGIVCGPKDFIFDGKNDNLLETPMYASCTYETRCALEKSKLED